MELKMLQIQSEAWSERNAPDSTAETTWRHIDEEVMREFNPAMRHLIEGWIKWDDDDEDPAVQARIDRLAAAVAEEAADIVILLAQLANKVGFDLGAEVERKWEKVYRRTYKKGKDGVYRHVKEQGSGRD